MSSFEITTLCAFFFLLGMLVCEGFIDLASKYEVKRKDKK